MDPELAWNREAFKDNSRDLTVMWNDFGSNSCTSIGHHHDPTINGVYVAAGNIGNEIYLIPLGKGNKFAWKVYEAEGVITSFVVLKDGRLLLGGAFKSLILLKPHRDEMYMVCGIFDTGSHSIEQI